MEGVLPRRCAVSSITLTTVFRALAREATGVCFAREKAARMVPAQVRKSFAVKGWPVIERKYRFTSSDLTER
jgi:hypothetical protein